MYEMTAQIHRRLGERGLKTGSDEFESAFDAEMEEQRKRVSGRLWAEVPARRHVCFYPMNKRRGEHEELVRGARRGARAHDARAREDRPALRRRRSPRSSPGAIGFDDWEWGVDLFADDPVVFKKLDLRDALRRGLGLVRGVRPVLRRPAVLPVRAAEVPGGRGPRRCRLRSGAGTWRAPSSTAPATLDWFRTSPGAGRCGMKAVRGRRRLGAGVLAASRLRRQRIVPDAGRRRPPRRPPPAPRERRSPASRRSPRASSPPACATRSTCRRRRGTASGSTSSSRAAASGSSATASCSRRRSSTSPGGSRAAASAACSASPSTRSSRRTAASS